MKNLLEILLNKKDYFILEDFYEKKDNVQHQKLLSEYSQLTLKEIVIWLQENDLLAELLNEIASINEEKLYHSFTHGINHNERVLFFVYFLGHKCNIQKKYMRILLDAAKYHDIGRVNDLLEPKHGSRSAAMIESVIDDSIYEEQKNINLLKAIIEIHSLHDKQIKKVMKNYNIKDEKLFCTLFSILKDADGLDRVRLTYMKRRFSPLNPEYLRISYSKELLCAAHELNELYEKNKGMTKGGKYEELVH